MRCADCPDVPNGTRKRPICCKRQGAGAAALSFVIAKGETMEPGDWVRVDQNNGWLVKSSGVPANDDYDGPVFRVPPGAVADYSSGTISWPLAVGDVVPHVKPPLDIRPAFTGAGGPSFKPARHGKRAPGR